ncbi:MAG: hypothetical protein F4Y72_07960 [Gammaproteobacteria bacterium]|nr:hypothetical protein [Gammaproteobacteria bacterium]
MNRPVELSLLRLPLGVMGYVALLVLPLGGMARNSDLHETSIFSWILAGLFFYAPLVGSLLGRECSLAWGRATALLPVSARVRMIVIWWRRVIAPAILVWVLSVLYALLSPVDSLSWGTALTGLALPFAGCSCWFLAAASSGAGFWTYRSRRRAKAGFLAILGYVAFLAIPFATLRWIDLEQTGVRYPILLLLLGVVLSLLALSRLYSVCRADSNTVADARPAIRQEKRRIRIGSGLTGFRLFAVHFFLYSAGAAFLLNLMFFLPWKMLELLSDFPAAEMEIFLLRVFPATNLLLLGAFLATKLSCLRVLRTLPLSANQISIRLTVMVALAMLLSCLMTAFLALQFYGSHSVVPVFLFSMGAAGIASCILVPGYLHLTPEATFSKQAWMIVPAFAATGLWIAVSLFFFADYLELPAAAVGVTGIVLTWILVREVLMNSSRAYRTRWPLDPAEEHGYFP